MNLPSDLPRSGTCCRSDCILLLGALLGLALSGTALASADDEAAALPKLAADVTQFDFEDLMAIEVTSVSKRAEPASAAAAAIFVLTGDEIRRSGVHRIAEALRLVPGLEVAQTSSKAFGVSARGFLGTSADKLEVLLDGRSVYTPLTSAVFWDVLDTYIPDIDRIEVIRGPGAALWGSNAVNGVINIVTRNAKDSQGAAATVYAGNEERYGASARLGTRVGDGGYVQLYGQGSARDPAVLASGKDAIDGQRMMQTGFRSDWHLAGSGALMVSGDAYQATQSAATIGDGATVANVDRSGGNLIARYECCTEDDGRWSLQASYDGYHYFIPTTFEEQRQTGAVDFQQQWLFGARQTVVYGLGYKYTHDTTGGAPLALIFDPQSRTLQTWSAFAQDQISLFDDKVKVTIGSKFEDNDLSGFEVQPSLRFGWQAADSLFTWAAVSRAVRTPNRLDQDVAIQCPEPDGFPGVCGPGLFRIGNPNLDSEKLIAYEWGLRWRARNELAFDLATYFNDYSKLRSTETTSPIGEFANRNQATGYGAELSIVWQPNEKLELRPFYNFLVLDAKAEAGGTDTKTAPTMEGSNPRHQAGLLISWVPAPRWYAGSFLRYVGTLPRSGTPSASSGSTRVPAYTELNLRLAHAFTPNLELGLVGQNLIHKQHPEFGGENTRSELQRSLFLELRWSWE
jgi:iron complex outermembrane receptor protein